MWLNNGDTLVSPNEWFIALGKFSREKRRRVIGAVGHAVFHPRALSHPGYDGILLGAVPFPQAPSSLIAPKIPASNIGSGPKHISLCS
jgi:hypothetical protein